MKKIWSLILLLGAIGFTACDNSDEISYQDITVNFAANQIGIDEATTKATVAVNLSRTANTDINVIVSFNAQDVVLGTDFTITPAPVNNSIELTIPEGSSSTSFTIEKKAGVLFDGNETIEFTITEIAPTSGFRIGDNGKSLLSFAAIVSEGSELTLEGKENDVNYYNVVYVDFSSNHQLPVARTSWNLGFYNGDDYRVVLNGSFATAAVSTGKSDISAVTLADAEEAAADNSRNISATPMSATGLCIDLIDSFDGSLEGTAFAAISANDDENMVYFVASETDKSSVENWYKVKVTRSSNGGYKIQYARVSETALKTIEVAKDAAYNFSFLSLETGEFASVEPQAEKWDIMWGYNVGSTMGMPYFMQDMVVINNIAGARVATVSVTDQIDTEFDAFGEAQLASLDFSSDRLGIGSSWRTTSNMGGATGSLGIKTDRFFVVETPDGYYYKMRFISMGLGNDGGERGRPVVRYTLIK